MQMAAHPLQMPRKRARNVHPRRLHQSRSCPRHRHVSWKCGSDLSACMTCVQLSVSRHHIRVVLAQSLQRLRRRSSQQRAKIGSFSNRMYFTTYFIQRQCCLDESLLTHVSFVDSKVGGVFFPSPIARTTYTTRYDTTRGCLRKQMGRILIKKAKKNTLNIRTPLKTPPCMRTHFQAVDIFDFAAATGAGAPNSEMLHRSMEISNNFFALASSCTSVLGWFLMGVPRSFVL